MLKTYLKKIFEVANREDAREESFYSSLEGLLNDYCKHIHKKDVKVTTLPKKTEAGNPDFRIWDGKQHIVGYIEAKHPTIDLEQAEDSEQLKRYRKTFPNIILTNFLEFRLYRNGDLVDKVLIGRPTILYKVKIVPPVEKEKEFFNLLDKFFSFSLPRFYDAKSLAVVLADKTRFLKDEVITEELAEEEAKKKGDVLGFYEAFKKYLIGELSKEEFADLYSQTITYGLFAARSRSQNNFNRKLAYDYIPHTIGILRDLFRFISMEEIPPRMEWIIDDIAEVLAVTDVNNLFHQYYHESKGKDPVIHFYETFLAEYDPETREKRGVYYTPEPVVSYIVKSIHSILKKKFGKIDGLASDSVTVLDPAGGTLTFLAEATKLATEEFVSRWGEGQKENFIKEHILKNFYAFELMMAPYAVGHLKMSFVLEELGYKLQKGEQFKLYLTNSLEMEELQIMEIPGIGRSLSEESHSAGEIKKEQPILVILGNPPYSVSSMNKSNFIEEVMSIYKEDVQNERNIQPLSDDYIKFIRFAHWKIEKTGQGIIGMITNNSYLSGLIHRGMRKKLLESFSEIYILNLHGNSRIGEKCPDGSKDENVFDIMQGVSIAIFIKSRKQKGLGNIFYQDVYGLRESKYKYLINHNIENTRWKKLEPEKLYYFFVKKDFTYEARYKKFISILDIFVRSSSGVKTHRDHFVVGFTKEEIIQKMRILTGNLPDELVRDSFKLKDTSYFKLKEAREKLKKEDWKKSIYCYSYRPFDVRYICYRSELIERNRYEIMKNFVQQNLGLVLMRKPIPEQLTQVMISENITDINFFGYQTYIFPLYIYEGKKKSKVRALGSVILLFDPEEDYEVKKPNLSQEIVEKLMMEYKKKLSPEQNFFYIYGVLYANVYRTKYTEFLKIDFPRIPFTKDYKLFVKISEYGKKLVDLHLLKSSEMDLPISKFQGKDDDTVLKVKYDEKSHRLYINKNKYFENVPKEVFEYKIGSYQVCDKWLKDKKGKILSLDDIRYYCKIVTALKKTIEIQKEIDKIYPEVEKDIIEF